MTDTTQLDDALRRTDAIDAYDQQIKSDHIIGQWSFEPMLDAAIGGPKPRGLGHVWPWSTTRPHLAEASRVLGPQGVGRTSIVFLNPGITQGVPGSTHTISVGIQIMRAQEVCWSHRHSMSALRFVIEGHKDAFTVVDGEPLPMETFDLLLTPRGAWHDHHNPTDEEVVWLDVLDLGLTASLNQAFFEPFGAASQPQRGSVTDSQGLRTAAVRPVWEHARESRLPVRYAWKDIEPVLDAYTDTVGDPYDGLALRYANPVTGGPTFQTMDCWVQQLVPGFEGKAHRRTSSSVGFVISGSGAIEIDGVRHALTPGDSFAVPNYAWHRLVNDSSEPLRLFTTHDIPALQALGHFYEEPEARIGASEPPRVPASPEVPTYRSDIFLASDESR
ncbi:gentisate 1,2-dioxygenase [Arthrobacter ginkgonis]|uniref:Gentisate 1,2-dioxygenase n=1 Tax=Arthrobacter ginkgonis TaxID=1630594 RepID=A0ABP7C385_9MICC